MSTPKVTPLVIGYNLPIQNFDFQIQDQGELGVVEFFPGQATTTIYGQEVSGYITPLGKITVAFCLIRRQFCPWSTVLMGNVSSPAVMTGR